MLALSGILYKYDIPEETAIEFVNILCNETEDEEKYQRISIVKATYQKGVKEGRDSLTGLSLLRDVILSSDEQSEESANKVIEQIKHILLPSPPPPLDTPSQNSEKSPTLLIQTNNENRDILDTVPFSIRQQLSHHTYKIISISPLRLIVSHKDIKQILLARIKKIPGNESDTETYHLEYGDVLIDAIPVRIIIYDNPIDKTRKYDITFSYYKNTNKEDKNKKTFTIGPCFLDQIVAELQSRNKVIKKSNTNDALSAIISAFEEKGLAIIHDKISTPGFFMVDDKLVANEINQKTIDLITEEENVNATRTKDKEEIISCIEILEELNNRWQKGVFPTVLRWAIMSPFSFILKEKGNWMPYLFLYGWSNAGKSTLGLIILAIWRKNNNKEVDKYVRGFTSINTDARFGSIISRDTYPHIINEVGSLSNTYHQHIVEVIKNAVENITARGRMENYRNYVNIPSLSPLVLTSNKNPPADDTGFKRRMILVHFDKTDSKDPGEAKRFEEWLKGKLNLLGVLGDFIYSYLSKNQYLLKEGNQKAEDISKIIVREFYKTVGKDAPLWLNDTVEQDTVQQNKEDVTVELRSFLLDEINNHYNKHYKTFTDSSTNSGPSDALLSLNNTISRLDFCLDNKLIPYFEVFKNKYGQDNIAITSNILKELRKKDIKSLLSLRDIANEIPEFIYDSRKFGNSSVRVAFGPRKSFLEFINREISDE